MKAAIFKGIKDLQVEEVPTPEAGPSDVVVEVSACGICGSDLHTYQHGSFVEPGQVMGHEFSGRVIAAGGDGQGVPPRGRRTPGAVLPGGGGPRRRGGRLKPWRGGGATR